jgi:hypothetical protein
VNIAPLLAVLCFCFCNAALAQEANDPLAQIFPDLSALNSTEDLSAMKDRKVIRALVTLSKTDFFIYNGQPKGFQAEPQ